MAVGFLVFVCLVSIICPKCTRTQLFLVPYSLLLEETFVQVQSTLVEDTGVPACLTLGLDTDNEKVPEAAEP